MIYKCKRFILEVRNICECQSLICEVLKSSKNRDWTFHLSTFNILLLSYSSRHIEINICNVQVCSLKQKMFLKFEENGLTFFGKYVCPFCPSKFILFIFYLVRIGIWGIILHFTISFLHFVSFL